MRITICQMPNDAKAFAAAWERLKGHARSADSDLVLLPEMPFSPWLAADPKPDPAAWQEAVERQAVWTRRLDELAPAAVVASRPVVDGGKHRNRAFACEKSLLADVHDKYYLPREDGYWEADWYERGDGSFDTFEVAGARAGVLLCTEMWFMHRGRAYGKAGAHLVLVPRATPRASLERWVTGGRTLAMISGCFVLSSNLAAPHAPGADLGGRGFAADPDGQLLATTTDASPFATVDIDLTQAESAKSTYPRYVLGDEKTA